jgi:hypothetical protein
MRCECVCISTIMRCECLPLMWSLQVTQMKDWLTSEAQAEKEVRGTVRVCDTAHLCFWLFCVCLGVCLFVCCSPSVCVHMCCVWVYVWVCEGVCVCVGIDALVLIVYKYAFICNGLVLLQWKVVDKEMAGTQRFHKALPVKMKTVVKFNPTFSAFLWTYDLRKKRWCIADILKWSAAHTYTHTYVHTHSHTPWYGKSYAKHLKMLFRRFSYIHTHKCIDSRCVWIDWMQLPHHFREAMELKFSSSKMVYVLQTWRVCRISHDVSVRLVLWKEWYQNIIVQLPNAGA